MSIKRIKSKTLVIQPHKGIADFMMYLPHIHAIAQRAPDKKVVLLTHPNSKADLLIQRDPYIEHVLWLDIHPGKHNGMLGALRLARLLEPFKFEAAWILHSRSMRYALSCWLAGIKKIFGPGYGMQRYFLTSRKGLTVPEQKKHSIERANLLLRKKSISFLDEERPLRIPSAELDAVEKKYKALPHPWISLSIGASKPYKKWPLAAFEQLAEKLYLQAGGTIFILGGDVDKEAGYKLHINLAEKNITVRSLFDDLWGALSIAQLSKFVVGNDTSITHGGPMVGTRALLLLGVGQEPIHYYTKAEGMRLSDSEDVLTEAENNLADLSADQVMGKLKDLGWI